MELLLKSYLAIKESGDEWQRGQVIGLLKVLFGLQLGVLAQT